MAWRGRTRATPLVSHDGAAIASPGVGGAAGARGSGGTGERTVVAAFAADEFIALRHCAALMAPPRLRLAPRRCPPRGRNPAWGGPAPGSSRLPHDPARPERERDDHDHEREDD